MPRDVLPAVSSTSRVITGTDATSGGQSHSCVRPTSESRSPRAQTMSVADGRSETIRISLRPALGASDDALLAQRCELLGSDAELAVDLLVAHAERHARPRDPSGSR